MFISTATSTSDPTTRAAHPAHRLYIPSSAVSCLVCDVSEVGGILCAVVGESGGEVGAGAAAGGRGREAVHRTAAAQARLLGWAPRPAASVRPIITGAGWAPARVRHGRVRAPLAPLVTPARSPLVQERPGRCRPTHGAAAAAQQRPGKLAAARRCRLHPLLAHLPSARAEACVVPEGLMLKFLPSSLPHSPTIPATSSSPILHDRTPGASSRPAGPPHLAQASAWRLLRMTSQVGRRDAPAWACMHPCARQPTQGKPSHPTYPPADAAHSLPSRRRSSRCCARRPPPATWRS